MTEKNFRDDKVATRVGWVSGWGSKKWEWPGMAG